MAKKGGKKSGKKAVTSSSDDDSSSEAGSTVKVSTISSSDSGSGSSSVTLSKEDRGNLEYVRACELGEVDEVRRLLKKGKADVGTEDAKGRTGLHLAASAGHVRLVRLFLKNKKTPINRLDNSRRTALDLAVQHEHGAVRQLLEAAGGRLNRIKVKTLIAAAKMGDAEKTKAFLKSKHEVDAHDEDHRTALHYATAHGADDVVLLLLKAGADPLKKDIFGVTPLEEAERHRAHSGDNHVYEMVAKAVGIHHDVWYRNQFLWVFLCFQVVTIILYALFTEYGEGATVNVPNMNPDTSTSLANYNMFQDVHIMIFIGFGFLMTFLRKFGFTAVGLNMLLAVFTIEWYVLASGFWHHALAGDFSGKIGVDLETILLADLAAAVVLITYGALIGKVSPTQMLVIAFVEVFFFALNEEIAVRMNVSDIGGSIIVHTFGAYFGLACSFFASSVASKASDTENGSNYRSDLFAMIGTIFLFCFWPSFNGYLAEGQNQHRAITNTVLSLAASTMMTFIASHLFRLEKKFDMVDVQNATLAGGVAIGAVADLPVHPAGALLIGSFAGTISVAGYVWLQPALESVLGLHDTAGVHNLHGMPGVLSGLISVLMANIADADLFGSNENLASVYTKRGPDGESAGWQAKQQILFLLITLAISIASGLLTGLFVSWERIFGIPKEYFVDSEYWGVPQMETPYYFDTHGEKERFLALTHDVAKHQGHSYSSAGLDDGSCDYDSSDDDTSSS